MIHHFMLAGLCLIFYALRKMDKIKEILKRNNRKKKKKKPMELDPNDGYYTKQNPLGSDGDHKFLSF